MSPEIKNLRKAADRLYEAVEKKERIILYGDSDPDGICSVIILKESLQSLGLRPTQIYFPDREEEGYGINEEALRILTKQAPGLFVALDCGIGNVKEVALANQLGFEVIIIDHHKTLPEIPPASIICNPKQKGDNYPFKDLATAGIIYKLSKLLFSCAKRKYEPEKFLELAAIATLADLMPLKNENEKLVREGVMALEFTEREGLRALIKVNQLENLDRREVQRKIISPLNASIPRNHLNETYLLLTEEDPGKAEKRAQKLLKRAREKKREMKQVYLEVEARIGSFLEIIFEGDENWRLVLLGTIASRVCQKYKKPVFLFKKGKKESPGAVRTPKGIDGVKAMISCAHLLKTYGGHPLAAGFRIKNENLEKFKDCLITYFKKLKPKT